MVFSHKPVLLNETLNYLNIRENGIYVDCTLGGGGHTEEILKKLKNGKVIAFDKDNDAITATKKRLKNYSDKLIIIKDDFKNAIKHLEELKIDKIDGYLIDLGVSSYQLDNKERGFSYMQNAELDMRMDRESTRTAKDIINQYTKNDLVEILKKYGEEKFATRIANEIIKTREQKEIRTTSELVEIIDKAVPAAYKRAGHPSKKTFQAIRIETNRELENLDIIINDLTLRLKKGGRGVVISFHSLEDRIAKQTFVELEKDCICPEQQIICTCDKRKEIKILTKKPVVAQAKEIKENKRAKSAKLRAVERI